MTMQNINNSDILAVKDDCNQYLLGNVTVLGLQESLQELLNKLNTNTNG